jgi:hypothetical protein
MASIAVITRFLRSHHHQAPFNLYLALRLANKTGFRHFSV